jgi:hypothetical protein
MWSPLPVTITAMGSTGGRTGANAARATWHPSVAERSR